MTRYINAYKIQITLPSCQLSNPKPVLDHNTINLLDLPSDNNKEDISPRALDNSKEGIRLVDMDNNKEAIRPTDIDK